MTKLCHKKSTFENKVDNLLWETTVLLCQAHGLSKALEEMFDGRIEQHASCSVVDALLIKMRALDETHEQLCKLIQERSELS